MWELQSNYIKGRLEIAKLVKIILPPGMMFYIRLKVHYWLKRANNLFTFLKQHLKGLVDRERPGGTLRYKRGPHPRYVFRGRRCIFLRPPHVRDFLKEGTFLYPGTKYGKYTWLWRPVIPEVTGLPSFLSPLAAAKQAENNNRLVKIRVHVHPMSVFWQKKGCIFTGKSQRV